MLYDILVVVFVVVSIWIGMRLDQVIYALSHLSQTHEYLLRPGVKVASIWCTYIRCIGEIFEP